MSDSTPIGGPAGRGRNGSVSGIVNIDKPSGVTSMDVVRRIKRSSGQKRVGHGGTLDPIATGVIPVCIGQATRMMEYVIEHTKEYRGLIELGVETDTYDAIGTVTRKGDASKIMLGDVERELQSFKGAVQQVPPMYSALKRQGKRLYDLARAGIEVEREARPVTVLRIELKEWSPPFLDLEVTCGRGFYMRSLAYDIGRALGCGGHLKSLVRRRCGPFKISEAAALSDAESKFADGAWRELLYAPDVVVSHMRSAIVGDKVEKLIRDGRVLPPGLGIPFSRPDEQCRVYGTDGRFIAIMSFNASLGQWKPDRVFGTS